MEKRTAHYNLAKVQALVTTGKFRITRTATDSALELGFGSADIAAVVCGLTRSDLY